jgi:hypothetical protein
VNRAISGYALDLAGCPLLADLVQLYGVEPVWLAVRDALGFPAGFVTTNSEVEQVASLLEARK